VLTLNELGSRASRPLAPVCHPFFKGPLFAEESKKPQKDVSIFFEMKEEPSMTHSKVFLVVVSGFFCVELERGILCLSNSDTSDVLLS